MGEETQRRTTSIRSGGCLRRVAKDAMPCSASTYTPNENLSMEVCMAVHLDAKATS